MKNIIAFAGSTSRKSINKRLAGYAAQQIADVSVTILDLNDFKLALFDVDYEESQGIPENARHFLNSIKSSDGIVLSLAEHNGAYSAAFKNLLDWMSRIDGKLWNNVPMLLMATSPGARGGASVLEIAKERFPYMGANIVSSFSLPSFEQNFSEEGILNEELKMKFEQAVDIFKNAIQRINKQ
jgi:chromate reductase, NAD(P)H dehydrogenase (quinone)